MIEHPLKKEAAFDRRVESQKEKQEVPCRPLWSIYDTKDADKKRGRTEGLDRGFRHFKPGKRIA